MKKSTLLMIVSVVLAMTLSLGGTLAYLQDSDSDVNVMTLGSVYIEQIEQERNAAGELVSFTENKPLYPAVYSGDSIPWADAADWAIANNEAWKVTEENVNVVDKFVTVTNTGKSDAYVRTIIAYEGDPINGTDIHIVQNAADSSNADVKGEFAKTEYIENVVIDNVRYDVIVYTYKNPLAPGATTIPSLKQVYMDKTCGNETLEKYGDTYDILALSQAVQTAGFADAQTALDTAFGTVEEKAAEWFGGVTPLLTVTNNEELKAALENNKDGATIMMAAGNYKMPNVDGAYATLMGSKDVVINAEEGQALNNNKITFNGVTIDGSTENYKGFQSTSEMEYVNCTIKDGLFLYAQKETFTNCEFDLTTQYIWTYGAGEVTFDNCVFNTDGKAILIYNEGSISGQTVNVKDCIFNATKSAFAGGFPDEACAAVEIDSSLISGQYVVNFAGTNVVDADFSGLVRIKKGAEKNNVVINGAEESIPTLDNEISSAAELYAFAQSVNNGGKNYAGETVVLTADIDLAGIDWEPIGQTGNAIGDFMGVFDGQGHTIYNLTVDSEAETNAHYASGLFGWVESSTHVTIKNVTIDGANIKGHHYVAVIAGYLEGNAVVEKCHVNNAVLSNTRVDDDANGDKTGAIAGYAAGEVRIKNCSATNVQIDSGRDAGQIVGAAKTQVVEDCTATNVTVKSNGTSTGANIREEEIGRVQ